ncbi:gamma-glutamyltransferase [Rubrimonas sp.]|uniref:gamma-glutamyltransferase n=1 Tax=Rubrimonas sp. TaxID=2036015 RepID=UPI002FDEF17C
MRLFALALLLASPLAAQEAAKRELQPEATVAVAAARDVQAASFMVAAAHPMAVEAGQAVLAAGGTAADAAVAVQLMLNLVEPQSSGIGGGAFALYWDASEARLTTFDGRETAPAAAGPDLFLGADGEPMKFRDAVPGGRSVGVPGTLKLIETLHARHGARPWVELIAPVIDAAEQGFAVSPRLAGLIAQTPELALFEATRSYFLDAAGAPLAEGAVLRNPDFAATLRLIAEQGADAFYAGPIAAQIAQAVRTPTNPGLLTEADLAAYRVIERAPVCLNYRGAEVCGMGPPSSGGLTVGQILGLLERFDLAALGPGAASDHLFVEASRLAFADRALYMADADFVDMPKGLLNRAYLAERSALIDPAARMATAEAGSPPWDEAQLLSPDLQPERPGTSHFVIVDAQGDVLSMTTTIETGFGSRVMAGGFLLNNELTDFSFRPEIDGRPVANRVEPGKRPRSSMAPTILLENGAPVLALGSPGGARIIGYVARALIALEDWGMTPAEAAALAHVSTLGGPVTLEQGTEAETRLEALAALGHEIRMGDLNSGLHIVRIAPGALVGAADPRREGVAAGQ